MATTAPELTDALHAFEETWTGELAAGIATKLTCSEADTIAELFGATGGPDLAAAWIREHSYGDDEGDSHARAE